MAMHSSVPKTNKIKCGINSEGTEDFEFKHSNVNIGDEDTTKQANTTTDAYAEKIEKCKNKVSGWALFTEEEKYNVGQDISKDGEYVRKCIKAIANIKAGNENKTLEGKYNWLIDKNIPGIIPVTIDSDGEYTILKGTLNQNEISLKELKQTDPDICSKIYKEIYIGIVNVIRNYVNKLSDMKNYVPLLFITPETVFIEFIENEDVCEVHIRILPAWPVNGEYSHYIPREEQYTELSDLYSASYIFVELAGEDRAKFIPEEIKRCLFPIVYMRTTNLQDLADVIREGYQVEIGRIRHGSGSTAFKREEKEPRMHTSQPGYRGEKSTGFVYENEQQPKNTNRNEREKSKMKDVFDGVMKFGRKATKEARKVVDNVSRDAAARAADFNFIHKGTLGASKGETSHD